MNNVLWKFLIKIKSSGRRETKEQPPQLILLHREAAVCWKVSHCYFLRDFFDALCCNYYYFGKKMVFPIKRKQEVSNCFEALISSVFTTVASRLILEQKEKKKYILKLNKTRFKLSNLWHYDASTSKNRVTEENMLKVYILPTKLFTLVCSWQATFWWVGRKVRRKTSKSKIVIVLFNFLH